MNKYKRLYDELIDFRKNVQPIKKFKTLTKAQKEVNLPPVYAALHHIKPVSIYPELQKEPSNLVVLTYGEHVRAHYYLALWYKDEFGETDERYLKMMSAYWRMTTAEDGSAMTEEEAAYAMALATEAFRVMSTGRKATPEARSKMKVAVNKPEAKAKKKASQQRWWNSLTPVEKAARNKTLQDAANRPDVKAKTNERRIAATSTPEFHARMSAINREISNRPEVKAKTAAHLAKRNQDPTWILRCQVGKVKKLIAKVSVLLILVDSLEIMNRWKDQVQTLFTADFTH